ncbi:MAG: hypothetical protein JOZ96_08985 [Acidobacteria bacterium]|nr:hypothetical protein [Acidobacteriota bacterium]
MSKRKGLLSVLFLVAAAAACAAQAQAGGRASLLVSYMENGQAAGEIQHVERIDFVGGEVVSRRRVVTLRHERDGYAGSVVNKRYLLTVWRNRVFDLQEGRFVDRGPRPTNTRGTLVLPGVVSPDGKKRVDEGVTFDGSTERLEIHFEGRPSVFVAGEFEVAVNRNSGFMPRLPLLWVDDEMILTQRSNGNLVTVSTGGAVKPFLRVTCPPDAVPSLLRNRSGKIVYLCGGENYSLDIERGRYEVIKDDLGNGFERDTVGGRDLLYYRGVEIGPDGTHAVTGGSRLAMLYGEPKDGILEMSTVKTVKVWSAAKRTWTTFTFDGWGAEIIGWIE